MMCFHYLFLIPINDSELLLLGIHDDTSGVYSSHMYTCIHKCSLNIYYLTYNTWLHENMYLSWERKTSSKIPLNGSLLQSPQEDSTDSIGLSWCWCSFPLLHLVPCLGFLCHSLTILHQCCLPILSLPQPVHCLFFLQYSRHVFDIVTTMGNVLAQLLQKGWVLLVNGRHNPGEAWLGEQSGSGCCCGRSHLSWLSRHLLEKGTRVYLYSKVSLIMIMIWGGPKKSICWHFQHHKDYIE